MVQTNPVKAIRGKCLDCCCGSAAEVNLCAITDCALYAFRLGKNPYRKKKEYTDEQKREIAQRLQKSHKYRGEKEETFSEGSLSTKEK